jgi:hypothetical protein
MDHFNELSVRDRKMRDVFQGFRALERTVHGPRPASGLAVLRDRRRGATDPRRDPSAQPWADAGVVEALTIEIFGETLGLNSDASIWRYACDHLRDWFPGLGSEWNFVRRCANLSWLKARVQDALFHPSGDWNAFDGLPLPVCRYARSRRDKRFRGEAAWSVCAAKQEKYYGFKAGVLMNSAGEIFRWWLGPANTDEREMLDAVVSAIPVRRQGADLRRLQLAGRGVDLTTPLRANMKDDRPPWLIRQAMRLRRRIETAFGRLVEDFGVLRNKGRDFWRWSARFLRKVLAYNLSLRFERTFME